MMMMIMRLKGLKSLHYILIQVDENINYENHLIMDRFLMMHVGANSSTILLLDILIQITILSIQN
jgi:hypothetical protein